MQAFLPCISLFHNKKLSSPKNVTLKLSAGFSILIVLNTEEDFL